MALDLDGTDDEVDHGDIAGVDGATVLSGMCWVYVDASSGIYVPYLAKISATTYTFTFGVRVNAGTAVFFTTTSAGSGYGETASGSRSNGVWEHWAFVYNGGGATDSDKVKIYKDGVNQSLTYTGVLATSLTDTGTQSVRAGRNVRDATFLNGRIALVKLWLAELTAAEVAQEYRSYRPVRTANLSLWSPYDDGVRAHDYSGQRNHGTVTGAAQRESPPVSYGAPD